MKLREKVFFFFFCSVQTEAEIIIFLFCFFVFVFHPKTIITFLNWFHSFLVAAQCENLSLLTSHEIKEKKCNTLKKISLINFVHFGLKRKLSSYSSHFPFTKGHTFFYCSSLWPNVFFCLFFSIWLEAKDCGCKRQVSENQLCVFFLSFCYCQSPNMQPMANHLHPFSII